METLTRWVRHGDAVRQASECGELVHLETASDEWTDAWLVLVLHRGLRSQCAAIGATWPMTSCHTPSACNTVGSCATLVRYEYSRTALSVCRRGLLRPRASRSNAACL